MLGKLTKVVKFLSLSFQQDYSRAFDVWVNMKYLCDISTSSLIEYDITMKI